MCKIMRGDFIESMHVAYAVVVDGKGCIVQNWGDPHYLTCIRSSLKPFQASASTVSGATEAAGFSSPELALMCASHNGEDIHVNTARGMMEKLGFELSHYECGSQTPYNKKSNNELIKQSQKPTALHNNCSGKHAGMLSLAKHLKADPKGYIHVNHPVQQAIMKQVRTYSELNDFPLAVDGCSAPVPFMPLYNIALMYQKFASGKFNELNILYDAMVANPMLVAGTDRFDTDFISVMSGKAITKVGGEAVRGLGIRKVDGEVYGIALKVLDGNQRCSPIAMMSILKEMDVLSSNKFNELEKYTKITLTNHRNLDVGSIKVEIM
jgi:L-asparaginase II